MKAAVLHAGEVQVGGPQRKLRTGPHRFTKTLGNQRELVLSVSPKSLGGVSRGWVFQLFSLAGSNSMLLWISRWQGCDQHAVEKAS